MAHIKVYFPTTRPQNNKIRQQNPSLRWRRIIHEVFSVLSAKRGRIKHFQLPVILTANQILWHCSNSQSALRPKSGCSEHKRERVVSGPIEAWARKRKCMGIAKIGPVLRFIRRSHGSRLFSIVRSDSICFYWNGWMKIDRFFLIYKSCPVTYKYSWFLSCGTSRWTKWIYKERYELLLLKRKQQLDNSLQTTKLKHILCLPPFKRGITWVPSTYLSRWKKSDTAVD